MIASMPAVQRNVRWVRRSGINLRFEKRKANRRHRRHLNAVTRSFVLDPERYYDEGFNAPSMSDYDLD